MLSSLLSSAFVIYLYRSLNATTARQPSENEGDALGSTLDDLNRLLAALEARLAEAGNGETAR